MAVRRRWLVLVCVMLAVLPLAVFVHRQTLARVTDVTLLGADGAAQGIAFPYSAPGAPTDRPLEFAFQVADTVFTQESFVIVPDDHLVSIAVNDNDVPLAGVDPKKLEDWGSGFRFPLGHYFKRGTNRVVVQVLNKGGGPGGLDVRPDPDDWTSTLELGAAAGACLVLVGAALRGAGSRWTTIAIAVAAVALRFAYLKVTPSSLRAHDVEGHLEYIQYLLDHHTLPKAADGYSFYHPPLYYVLSAVAWSVLHAMGFTTDTALAAQQVQSMLWELGFAAFSIGTARLWMDRIPEAGLGRGAWSRDGLAALFAALILLWPSTVMHSVRIGNDDLTYLCFSAGLYFASRWWLGGRDRHLYLAAAAGALAVLTKTSGVLVFAVLLVLFAARLGWRDRERRPGAILKRAWPVVALFLVSTGGALGRAVVDTLAGRQEHLLVGNASRNTTDLLVGNRADNYLWFDLRVFVTQAFTSPWDDAKGRQFFWNYLLKTSLFGEWTFAHPWAWNLGVVLSVLCLGMCLHVAIGTLVRSGSDWLDELPLFVAAASLVGALVLLRIEIPSACSGDFRYVLPVLMPFGWWYVRGLAAYRERGWVRAQWAAGVLAWLFAGLSGAFVLVIACTAP